MRKQLTALLFLCASLSAMTQVDSATCNCLGDLEYLIAEMEGRAPSKKEMKRKTGKETYEAKKKRYRERIAKVDQPDSCQAYLNGYLRLWQDKHLKVFPPRKGKRFPNPQALFELKSLSDSTWYLRMSSFNASLWQEIDRFYDSIVPLVQAKPYLILDVRNNSGGGPRMYNQLVKAITDRKTEPRQIALVHNGACASACEQFSAELGKHPKVTTFGKNTYGALAYGMIKGLKTPNCGFVFIKTTRRWKKYVPYEMEGVPPDVRLSSDDWVEEILSQWPQKP